MELEEIEQCKTWEEEMYWKYFHSMHFYLFLPKDFHDHLVLPSKFAAYVSSKLPNKVSLIGPSRFSWNVDVSKTGSLALIGDGWKDFAKTYNLEEEFLLLFKYNQNSSFEVLIFDQKNICEKEFSYFVKKSFSKPNCRTDRQRSGVEAVFTEMVEDDGGGGGSSKSVLSKNSKKGASVNGKRNNPEAPRAFPSDGPSKNNHNDLEFVESEKARDEKIEVLSESDQYKTWEQEMYWKLFHTIHFYQVLPKDFHVQLVLPSKFAEHMSSKLLNKVSLIGPSGITWDISVSKTGTLALVGDEWEDFAKTYSLEENQLIIFKYKQNSSFEVLIFDQNNLCEKESSYFIKKCLSKPDCIINKKRSVVEAASTEMTEDNDDGGSEHAMFKRPKKAVADEGLKNMPEAPRTCPSDEFLEENHDDPDFVSSDKDIDIVIEKVTSGGRKSCNGSKSCLSNETAARDEGRPSKAAKSMAQSAKKLSANNTTKKLSQLKEMEQIPSENGVRELFEKVNLSADSNCNVSPDVLSPEPMNEFILLGMNRFRSSAPKRGRPKRAFPISGMNGRNRLYKEYKSQRRAVTNLEKEDALRRASEAFTEGSFIVVMRPSSVYKRFFLNIPADWMHRNLPRRNKQVNLRVGEKTWETMFLSDSRRASAGGLGSGWKNFTIHNNLEDSDVCLFKPASKKDDNETLVLDVEIFRVVQEITPLTPLLEL